MELTEVNQPTTEIPPSTKEISRSVNGEQRELSFLKKGERVPEEKVNASIDVLAQRYGLSKEKVEEAKKVTVLRVDAATLAEALGVLKVQDAEMLLEQAQLQEVRAKLTPLPPEEARTLQETIQTLKAGLSNKDQMHKDAAKQAQSTNGRFFILPDGSRVILLQQRDTQAEEDSTLLHENAHNLATNGKRTGFVHVDPVSGRFLNDHLNEGVTDLLRSGAENPDVDQRQLLQSLAKLAESQYDYKANMGRVATVLSPTYQGLSPVSLEELSEMYFNQPSDVTYDTATPLAQVITRRTPEHLRLASDVTKATNKALNFLNSGSGPSCTS